MLTLWLSICSLVCPLCQGILGRSLVSSATGSKGNIGKAISIFNKEYAVLYFGSLIVVQTCFLACCVEVIKPLEVACFKYDLVLPCETFVRWFCLFVREFWASFD